MQLGMVDLDAPLASQVAAMARACEVDGFFRIPVTVVEPEIRGAAWEAASAFFDLSESDPWSIARYGYSDAAHRLRCR